MTIERVAITPEATEIIDKLRDRNGPLFFHQSGGCCDGSSPMCFQVGELMLNETDVKLGTIHDCDFICRETNLNIGNTPTSRLM